MASDITEGWAVEFDTYRNQWDPSNNHVGVDSLERGTITPLTTVNLEPDLRTGIFEAQVLLEAGRVKLYLSNTVQNMPRTLVIDYTIPNYVPFDGYVGLIGQTGADTDKHVIHRARLWTEKQ